MEQAVNGNKDKQVTGCTMKSSSLAARVALAKKKIKKEVWAQLKGIDASDARLRLGILYQALDDLHIGGIGVAGRSMAVVYLYSSEIKELEEMNIDTGWVQRILNEMQILDVANPRPYIEACEVIQQESRKVYSRGLDSGLTRFIPVCEGVSVKGATDRCNQAA